MFNCSNNGVKCDGVTFNYSNNGGESNYFSAKYTSYYYNVRMSKNK